jgi:predicted XRE-type DNA-binding protein
MKKFASVWDALENSSETAESMKARATLMMRIQRTARNWKLSQVEAGRRLGITQPRLNDLLNGKIERFSLDALFDLASRAGMHPSIGFRKAA